MGMYTKVTAKFTLNRDVPEDVLFILKYLHRPCDETFGKFHKLTEDYGPNFDQLFNRRSSMTFDEETGCWSVEGKGELKNYDDEVEQFFGLVSEHTNDHVLGTYEYEDWDSPETVYNDTYV